MKQIRTTICLIAIAFLGVFASAQTPTGTIQGVVTDKTGAAVQGASVTVIRTTTNGTKTSTTDSAGRYSFVFVEPGVYNVTAQAKGFRAAKQDNVLVQVTETRPVNFTLEVGAVAQTVEVNAQDVQALDTETRVLERQSRPKPFSNCLIRAVTRLISPSWSPASTMWATLRRPTLAAAATATTSNSLTA